MKERKYYCIYGILFILALSNGNSFNFVDVFTMGENGYYCIKIPDLIITNNKIILAFGEARMNSCSDYTWTDLVYKISNDSGQSWGPLQVLYSNSSANSTNVIGNACPVVDRTTNRIVVPFCRNNLEVWITYSEDDGDTWTTPEMIPNVTLPEWGWVGTGPPGGIQLSSGRIVVTAYHSNVSHYTDGEISRSHSMTSDDGGNTWVLRGNLPGPRLRLQSLSFDGGETWGSVSTISDLVEPFEGCEGSTIYHPVYNYLFFSNPSNHSVLRFNMSVHISKDQGNTWDPYAVVNGGRSGYSALLVLPNNSVALLFERSNLTGLVFIPQAITYAVVWTPSSQDFVHNIPPHYGNTTKKGSASASVVNN